MKKLKAILLIPFIIMGLTITVVAQSQILAFHFNGQNGKQTTSTSTTTNANLLTSTMSRGAGALANSSSTNTINANMVYSATKTAAKTNQSYFEFFVQAKSGYFVSLTGLDAVLRIQTNSANTYRWMYSLDNGVNFFEIGNADVFLTDLNNNGTVQPQVPITNLYNIPSATKIIFRLYVWGGNNIVDNTTTAFSIGKSSSTLNAISVKGFLSNIQVPGKVLGHKAGASNIYLGSPSICKLANGHLIASNDFFGPNPEARVDGKSVTRIYKSEDGGATWYIVTDLVEQFMSNLFVHKGNLYIIGLAGNSGNVVIRKSTDQGLTWTTPTSSTNGILKVGRFHTAPTPVVSHNGRLWRAMEDVEGDIQTWPKMFRAFMMSVDEDDDLLNAANWLSSNAMPYDASYVGGYFYGWLEGNAVVGPGGNMLNVARVHTFDKYRERVALINVNATGSTSSFNATTGFKDFPGGGKKFTIRYDSTSNKYWTLSSYVPVAYRGDISLDKVRNTLALCSSTDLVNWDIDSTILNHPDTLYHAFQYVDWQFDGNDIIAVSRTAYDDGLGGANSAHNNNYFTFHRITNYQTAPTLALNISSLKGETLGDRVVLKWQNKQTETENPYLVYRIEEDKTIKYLGGAERTTAKQGSQAYSYTDNHPKIGANYYQIKQLDKKGKEDFSEVVKVFFGMTNQTTIHIIPNADRTTTKLMITHPDHEKAKLKIVDTQGKTIKEIALKLEKGTNVFEFPIWLPKGIYVGALLTDGGHLYSTKFTY